MVFGTYIDRKQNLSSMWFPHVVLPCGTIQGESMLDCDEAMKAAELAAERICHKAYSRYSGDVKYKQAESECTARYSIMELFTVWSCSHNYILPGTG